MAIHQSIYLHIGSQHTTCNRNYDKVYCFKRNLPYYGAELFNTLVMTDRDREASQYGGQDIDWDNWAEYTHGYVYWLTNIHRFEFLQR